MPNQLYTPFMANIGQQLGQGMQQRGQNQRISAAMQGDPNALRELYSMNPNAAAQVDQTLRQRASQAAVGQQAQTDRQRKLFTENEEFINESLELVSNAQTFEEGQAIFNQQKERLRSVAGDDVDLFNLTPEVYTSLKSQKPGAAVQSSDILKDGTTIQVLKDGSTVVTDPQGNKLSGSARSDAITKASEEGIRVAGATVSAQEKARTREFKAREEGLTSEQLKIEKSQIDVARKRVDLNRDLAKQDAIEMEATDTMDLGNTLMAANLASIYGRGESLFPELARSQEGIDLIAQRDRFVSTLELAQAGKMKGQGQVSEGERVILKKAATVLSNPNISPELAQQEIQRAIDSINRTLPADQQIPGTVVNFEDL